MNKSRALYFFLLILIGACVDRYKFSDAGYQKLLVVEGFLSNEADNYFVRLSQTSKLDERKIIPETQAQVWIKSSFNDSIPLTESQAGVYQTPKVSGVLGVKYKLYFVTKEGKSYFSDEVTLKEVPAIDSVYGEFVDQLETRGIQILVSSTGNQNQSRYYRWQCIETYEVHTPRPSDYEWLGGNNVAARTQRVDICWHTDTIKNILKASTSSLAENRVVAFPLNFVPEDFYAFQIKYSVLVKQYSLSEAGYQYWNNVKSLNETQGSFFDIQPGVVRGNIHSTTDEAEVVLGYFDASSVDSVRAFFTPAQFRSKGFTPEQFEAGCDEIQPQLVQLENIGQYFAYNGYDKYAITDAFGFYPDVLIAVLPKSCCDCTFLGTNKKPSFWK